MQSWSRTPARSLLFVCHLLMLELWHKRTLSHFTFRRLEASRYRRTATTTQCVECEWCRLIIHLLLKISSEFNSIFSISQRNSQSRMNDMSVLCAVHCGFLNAEFSRISRMANANHQITFKLDFAKNIACQLFLLNSVSVPNRPSAYGIQWKYTSKIENYIFKDYVWWSSTISSDVIFCSQ